MTAEHAAPDLTGYASARLAPVNLKEEAISVIRSLIMEGRLKAGDKIDQDALSASLGVSRLPVREALIVLEREGFVHTVARRGCFVALLTRDDVRDHYEMYALIAGMTVERSAVALTDDDLAELGRIADSYDAAVPGGQGYDVAYAFHRGIYRVAGSRRLVDELRSLARTIPNWLFTRPEDDQQHDEEYRQYLQAVLAVLRTRNGPAAAQLVQENIRRSGARVIDRLDELGFWSGTAEGA